MMSSVENDMKLVYSIKKSPFYFKKYNIINLKKWKKKLNFPIDIILKHP